MGTGQMLLVLLAIVLFSTIIVSTRSNMATQNELLYDNMYRLQGLRVANKFFQEIESLMIGQILTFAELNSTYTNYTQTITVDDVNYHNTIDMFYCDDSGNITNDPDSEFQLIEIKINTTPLGKTLHIGTDDNPLSKVIADIWG
jgi:hypothetical protein